MYSNTRKEELKIEIMDSALQAWEAKEIGICPREG
jgi:hypothetical protein